MFKDSRFKLCSTVMSPEYRPNKKEQEISYLKPESTTWIMVYILDTMSKLWTASCKINKQNVVSNKSITDEITHLILSIVQLWLTL